MKCINKTRFLVIGCLTAAGILLAGFKTEENTPVTEYETANYNQSIYEGTLYTQEADLCVAEDDVSSELYSGDTNVHAAALFDLSRENVLYSYSAHEQIYPASVTKIMTALLALEEGNPDDSITISSQSAASSFPSDAQVCGLVEGEIWTLNDLLNALLLYSGNDAATAIAEYVAGSEEAFVNMMNAKAGELMASNTHFTNPHGLHDDEHYTTAYDLYLIFNECIKDERFTEIIQRDSYTAHYTKADGTQGEAVFEPTNYYSRGLVDEPGNVSIIGGKTGTTGEAGCCLILMEQDEQNNPYISVVMGAPDKTALYADMTALIQAIPDDVSQYQDSSVQ